MSEKSTRERIIEAADRLFYERGFETTSFADIAAVVGLSRGNFYHHFKSKDEILDAVIVLRLENTRQMIGEWERWGDAPGARVLCFVHILIAHREDILRFGCPVGTLCSELVRLGHPAHASASELFTVFRVWLRRQFVRLGHKREADAFAMHLLARSQGIAILASTFHDPKFIEHEVRELEAWLRPHLLGCGDPLVS